MWTLILILYKPRETILVVFVSSVLTLSSPLHFPRELLILTNTDGKTGPYGFYFRVVSVEVFSSEKIITELQLSWLTHFRYAWKWCLRGFDPTTEMINAVHRHHLEMCQSVTLSFTWCRFPPSTWTLRSSLHISSAVCWYIIFLGIGATEGWAAVFTLEQFFSRREISINQSCFMESTSYSFDPILNCKCLPCGQTCLVLVVMWKQQHSSAFHTHIIPSFTVASLITDFD